MVFSRHVARRPVRGFTLIEVMTALVIVSLGMLAVIQAVSQTAGNNAYLRDKTLAHWVAMNRVTELRLTQQAPAIGESSGETEMGGRRWRWTTEVTPTAVESMRRIDVRVFEANGEIGSDPGQLAAVTGFYGAKVAPPGTVRAQFDAAPIAPAPGASSSSSSSSGGATPAPGSSSSGGTTGSGGSPGSIPRN